MQLTTIVDKCVGRDIDQIDRILGEKDQVREEAIRLSREILRSSTEAVRLIHINKYDEAKEKIMNAREKVSILLTKLKNHPDLLYSGLVYGCLSEFVEAVIVYNLIVEKSMPSFNDINVPYVPYLQGLADSIGELRRYVIDLLRWGKYDDAGMYLDVMEVIYQWLRKLNYPDALIPGVRHKIDVARRLIEDTKTLYLQTIMYAQLRDRLDKILSDQGKESK